MPAGKTTVLPTGSVGETDEALPEATTASDGLLNRPDTLQDTQLDASDSGQSLHKIKEPKTIQSKKEGLPVLPGHGRNERYNRMPRAQRIR